MAVRQYHHLIYISSKNYHSKKNHISGSLYMYVCVQKTHWAIKKEPIRHRNIHINISIKEDQSNPGARFPRVYHHHPLVV